MDINDHRRVTPFKPKANPCGGGGNIYRLLSFCPLLYTLSLAYIGSPCYCFEGMGYGR